MRAPNSFSKISEKFPKVLDKKHLVTEFSYNPEAVSMALLCCTRISLDGIKSSIRSVRFCTEREVLARMLIVRN